MSKLKSMDMFGNGKVGQMDASVINISVSGGRTSAYMAWWMNENRKAVADYIGCEESEMKYHFTFANTGMEHDDTLRFMNDVDQKLLGGKVVWLEGVTQHGELKSTGHRIVNYDSAYRSDQYEDVDHPFHSYIRKYGIPNIKMLSCTREMKRNTINSYMMQEQSVRTNTPHNPNACIAIGIRDDESRRVVKNATEYKIIYPLIDLHPVDKEDVLDWFSQYDWDLAIPEWQGNCLTCYKKSFKKLNKVYEETPEAFNFCSYMEKNYSRVGYEFTKYDDAVPRTFFRNNQSTDSMIALFKENPSSPGDYINIMNDAGCSESCEMYETEQMSLI